MKKLILGSLLSFVFVAVFIPQIHAGSMSSIGGPSLRKASATGDIDRVNQLLNHGTNVNSVSRNGDTALMRAAKNGQAETVQILLNHGADVNFVNIHGRTALLDAIKEGYTTITQTLLAHGADVNYVVEYSEVFGRDDGATPLYYAVKYNQINTVQLLLDYGANINFVAPRKPPVLILAAQMGHTEIVRLLLEKGANKNIRNAEGKDAWKLSANLECKQLLKNFQPHGNQVKSARNVAP